jgi:hypothetical protein
MLNYPTQVHREILDSLLLERGVLKLLKAIATPCMPSNGRRQPT